MSEENIYSAPKTEVAAPQTTNGYLAYAGFWRRFVAALVDGIITTIVALPISIGLGIIVETSDNGAIQMALEALSNILSIVIAWLYGAYLESSSKQATLGKQLLKIKVTDLQGNPISFARASGRHFAKIISSVILCIGYLMMLWSDRKQTLHDKMSGCLVMKHD